MWSTRDPRKIQRHKSLLSKRMERDSLRNKQQPGELGWGRDDR